MTSFPSCKNVFSWSCRCLHRPLFEIRCQRVINSCSCESKLKRTLCESYQIYHDLDCNFSPKGLLSPDCRFRGVFGDEISQQLRDYFLIYSGIVAWEKEFLDATRMIWKRELTMFTTSRTDFRIDGIFLLLSVFKAHVRVEIINTKCEQKLLFNFNECRRQKKKLNESHVIDGNEHNRKTEAIKQENY